MDPDATLMRVVPSAPAELGYQRHYVVDGGNARITSYTLVEPADAVAPFRQSSRGPMHATGLHRWRAPNPIHGSSDCQAAQLSRFHCDPWCARGGLAEGDCTLQG